MIRRKQILWIKLVQKIPKKLATWFKDDPLLILIEYIFTNCAFVTWSTFLRHAQFNEWGVVSSSNFNTVAAKVDVVSCSTKSEHFFE